MGNIIVPHMSAHRIVDEGHTCIVSNHPLARHTPEHLEGNLKRSMHAVRSCTSATFLMSAWDLALKGTGDSALRAFEPKLHNQVLNNVEASPRKN